MSLSLSTNPEIVAVFGLGYVGSVTAACLAQLGHSVIGVDRDEYKVRSINAGKAPFFEPGLEEVLAEEVRAGRLKATTHTAEGVSRAGIAMLCVGTPSERNGNLDISQLRRVTEDIASALDGRQSSLVLAVRSTVFPGTCEEVVWSAVQKLPGVSVVSNPEFLREGVAMKDFLEPSLVVVGGTDPASVRRVAGLYEPLGTPVCEVSLRTAEMIKYACNAYHAVKISFANEIDAVAAQLGVDGAEVMETLCKDTKLNTSSAYLRPGFAFGGSCLPKDLRALNYRALQLDIKIPMLNATLPSNDAQLRRAIDRVLGLEGNLGVYGLSFKEDTDDLRESPVVTLLEFLIGKGRSVSVFDPHIRLDSIYGSNRNYVLNAIPHIGRLLENDLQSMLTKSSAIVLTQKPQPSMAEQLRLSGKPLIDLAGSAFMRS